MGDGVGISPKTKRKIGLPSENRKMATLYKADKKIIVVKDPETGMFKMMEPSGEKPCGKDGCDVSLAGIIAGNVGINVNTIGKERKIPASKEETDSIIEDMSRNPEKYGDYFVGQEPHDVTKLSSVVGGIQSGISNVKNNQDSAKQYFGDAITWAVQWMYNNVGDKNFIYGDLNHEKAIGNLTSKGVDETEAASYFDKAGCCIISRRIITIRKPFCSKLCS